MANRTYLLGVGAQKCGTDWLSGYINKFDHVDTGAIKEYRTWNVFARTPECQGARISFLRMLRHYDNPEYRLRRRLQQGEAAYFAYFEELLADPKIRLTGDITPTYTALSDRDFARIRAGFEKRGIAVKPVLLMRDPFERCWSAVRHYKRNKRPGYGIDLTLPDEEALLGYLKDSHSWIRTNYHTTIQNLERVFGRDEVFYGIFEELFTPDSLHRLAAYLDVPVDEEQLSKAVNTTVKRQSVSETGIRAAAETFREVYAFCADRFPQTRELWIGNRYLT